MCVAGKPFDRGSLSIGKPHFTQPATVIIRKKNTSVQFGKSGASVNGQASDIIAIFSTILSDGIDKGMIGVPNGMIGRTWKTSLSMWPTIIATGKDFIDFFPRMIPCITRIEFAG